MRPIVVAIHGILTRQMTASWVDRLNAEFSRRDMVVVKKEYLAAPLPIFNTLIKNRYLAAGLVSELELMVDKHDADLDEEVQIYFVSHSNGTDIALKTIRALAEREIPVAGAVFVGSVLDPDVRRNGILDLVLDGKLGKAIAYCSRSDGAIGIPHALPWCAYKDLGVRGWTCVGKPYNYSAADGATIKTRFFPSYGHGDYFVPGNIDKTFALFLEDLAVGHQTVGHQTSEGITK